MNEVKEPIELTFGKARAYIEVAESMEIGAPAEMVAVPFILTNRTQNILLFFQVEIALFQGEELVGVMNKCIWDARDIQPGEAIWMEKEMSMRTEDVKKIDNQKYRIGELIWKKPA